MLTRGACYYKDPQIVFQHGWEEFFASWLGYAGKTQYWIPEKANKTEARKIIAEASYKEWQRIKRNEDFL